MKPLQTLMKKLAGKPALVGILSLLAVMYTGLSQAAGLLVPVNSTTPLAIKSHEVDVVIEDGYAVTSVEQVFINDGNTDLEAIYSFPVPKDASVGQFTYWIDGKPVHGEVLPKQKAREVYEQEKQQGRETALVEKDEYRTFDISVFPVRANQEVKTKLVYMQPVFVDMGVGRYVYPLEEGGVDEQKLSFWGQADGVKQSFRFDVTFRSRYPIADVRFPSHGDASLKRTSDQEWNGSLVYSLNQSQNQQQLAEEGAVPVAGQDTVVTRLDKDIVVYWRHQAGLPGAVDLVTYREGAGKTGTFALTVTPGEELAPLHNGRDWVFVLDISGSMQGKIATLAEGVSQSIAKMSAQDRVRIITFNQSATDITRGYITADEDGKRKLEKIVRKLRADGSTNLYAGLAEGLKDVDADRTSSFVLVTDGVANVGVTEKKQFFKLLDQADVRLFTFVMGNSANRPLLEGMAKYSNGFAQSISNADDIVGQVLWALEKVTHESLRDVQVSIDGVRVDELSPKDIGTLYRGQQLMVFGHYRNAGDAIVEVTGKIGGEEKSWKSRVHFPETSTLNPELERLWGFAHIKELETSMDKLGANADTEQAIQDIAMQYGLVTDYTSMIVLREEMYQQYGIARANKQRIEKEENAQAQRAAQPVQAYQPQASTAGNSAWSQPRPTFGGGSGGGSIGGMMVLIFSLVALRRLPFIYRK